MTNKTAAEWMKEKIAKYEDSFDFKHEELVLGITEQICNAMEEKGIDRAELADKLGVSRAFISKLLNGTPNLTTETLLKITLALGRELSVKLPPAGFTTAHQSYTTISSLASRLDSAPCGWTNCNKELCTIFKTNELASDEWKMLPPCKSTVDNKFMLYEFGRSYEIDINDNLSMLLFQMKNLSLEDAITITKVKNEMGNL